MKVNKYVVLHSGDRVLMHTGLDIGDIVLWTEYYNTNLISQLKGYKPDITETASHIELVLTHKDT